MKLDKRKGLFAGVAVASVIAVGSVARGTILAPEAPKPATVTAGRGDVEQTVLATGSLEPIKLVSVGAQVSGQVQRLHVALGQQVKKGDLIAEIDSAPQQNALRTAEANLQNVRAQRLQLQASLAQAELVFQRQSQMLAADATAKADYDAAEAALKSARAQLAANQAQIAQASVAVQSAQLNLGYTRIVAPIDGTVVAIVTKEGQTVNANQAAPTIVKLGDLTTMTVKAEISEADVAKVAPGQKVYFTVLGDAKRRYYATLRTVEPAPESIETADSISSVSTTGTAIYYDGLFDVPNPDGRLRTFMTAQVSIVLAEAKDAVTLPTSALGTKRADGAYEVRVVGPDGELEPRFVKLGLNNGAVAQVTSGLDAGEEVALSEPRPAQGAAGAPPAGGPQRRGPPNAFGF